MLSLILPAKWYFEQFVTKSMWLILLGLGYWAYFNKNFQAEAPFPTEMFKWMPIVAGGLLCLTFLLDRVNFLRKIVVELADRIVIFLYIFLPYYTGYEPEDSFELYDIEDDPEELRDLYPALPTIAKQMREELLEAFWTANEPYGK